MFRKRLAILCAITFASSILVNSYFLENEKQPTYLTVLVGHYVLLDCDVDFPQDIEIPHIVNWKRGNKTVFSWYQGTTSIKEPYIGRIQLLTEPIKGYGRASINLTAIREDDAGWFECEILFPNRTPNIRNNGTWFYLTVNGGNVVAIPPVNQTVLEGKEAQFTCAAKENHTAIIWFKDGIPIAKQKDLLRRSVVTDQGTLYIYPTSMDDLGEYECEAMNTRGEVQRVRAFLDVQYKAKVISAPDEVFLAYGKPAVLDCDFRANPPLSNLRWEKDGFLFDPYNVKGVYYRRNGSLYFNNVDESHNGYYCCTPYNNLGTEGPGPKIHVIVQRPPTFTITPHNLYLRKRGETLELPCDAWDGFNDHRPIMGWLKKDGNPLPEGRYDIQNGNLTIINVQPEDRGVYVCTATNEAAVISVDAELIVENVPPNAPYNLSATSSYDSVHLKWSAGRSGSSPVEYSVWYRQKNSPAWRTASINNPRLLEATIANLQPNHEYEFMVLSKNRHGDGLFSKSIRVWTKAVPGEGFVSTSPLTDIEPPLNFTIHLATDGYLVTWDPPIYDVENLKSYKLKWWQQGSDPTLANEIETSNTSYLVSGLDIGYDYNFQVFSVSRTYKEAGSDILRLNYPGYKNLKAISTGIISVFALVAVAFVIFYCTKKKWWRRAEPNAVNEKK